MINKLVIASSNLGKVAELEEYLHDLNFTLIPKPQNLDIEETETTFIANAKLKASQVAIATQEWSIADDSGLEVEALNGAPGVFSARYADTDEHRIKRLLSELGDKVNRQAQFVCAIAVSNPDGKIIAEVVGICRGEILYATRGNNGFGYDPVFYVPEHNLTFAEMAPSLKAQISHRAKAIELLRPQLIKRI